MAQNNLSVLNLGSARFEYLPWVTVSCFIKFIEL